MYTLKKIFIRTLPVLTKNFFSPLDRFTGSARFKMAAAVVMDFEDLTEI